MCKRSKRVFLQPYARAWRMDPELRKAATLARIWIGALYPEGLVGR